MTIAVWDLTARLALAGALGALVGFEREARNHPAGMRTHALVGLGACLFTVAGAYGFTDVGKGTNVNPDRVAAQVATGIGFIGAGAILRSGLNVRGLTTAATLWLVAALGVTVGAGAYATAAIGFAVVLAVLIGLRLAKPVLLDRVGSSPRLLVVEYERGHGTLARLFEELDGGRGELDRIQVESENGIQRALIQVSDRDDAQLGRVIRSVAGWSEIVGVRLEDGVAPEGVPARPATGDAPAAAPRR